MPTLRGSILLPSLDLLFSQLGTQSGSAEEATQPPSTFSHRDSFEVYRESRARRELARRTDLWSESQYDGLPTDPDEPSLLDQLMARIRRAWNRHSAQLVTRGRQKKRSSNKEKDKSESRPHSQKRARFSNEKPRLIPTR
ncbi:uncharacterized protein GGS25DRAFT_519633 [Hypoxylon fragiforme]|uniref:uncharacterized protein n=1 Tax=Hypoxylon fragiforme TaxID=63214 RepID=UPI0020C64AB6|nr:uncharacterized protein GGS25DRAFT_519633 [Hypoxylon fragiforme]KAI2611328.1 hypothetical protein GGS25DRAFT_519633 [Hypoxylon fragiforme]